MWTLVTAMVFAVASAAFSAAPEVAEAERSRIGPEWGPPASVHTPATSVRL